MNDIFGNDFNNKTFKNDGNDSAVLKKIITIHQIFYLKI